MKRIVTSAPGKVVLCGEYAVLDGVSGLSMAVNRRARVTVTRLAGEISRLETCAFGDASFLAHPGGGIGWQCDADRARFGLFEQVWQAAPARPEGAYSFVLDTALFRDRRSGQKLGLGSSAALAVGLARALSGIGADTSDVAETAQVAHRRFQDGRGSGIDVATSAAGGVVEFRPGGRPQTKTIGWPPGLEYALIFSGQASDTADKIARYAPGSAARDLGPASADVLRCWRAGQLPALLDGLRSYVEALAAFDLAQSLGIFDAGHRKLVELAFSRGLVYKPCGAGGGDIGVVMSEDRSKVRGFVREAENVGFRRLDAALDERGVDVEELERD